MYFYRYLCYYLLSAFISGQIFLHKLEAVIITLAQQFPVLVNLFPVHTGIVCFTLKSADFKIIYFVCFVILFLPFILFKSVFVKSMRVHVHSFHDFLLLFNFLQTISDRFCFDILFCVPAYAVLHIGSYPSILI